MRPDTMRTESILKVVNHLSTVYVLKWYRKKIQARSQMFLLQQNGRALKYQDAFVCGISQ